MPYLEHQNLLVQMYLGVSVCKPSSRQEYQPSILEKLNHASRDTKCSVGTPVASKVFVT